MRSWFGARRGLVVLAAALLGLPVLTYGGVEATSTPALCLSCHEITPAVASWKRSPHELDPKTAQARATCRDCHVPSWRNPLAAVWGKASHGARDLYAHLFAPEAMAQPDFYFRLKGRILMGQNDEACLDCHADIRGAKDTIKNRRRRAHRRARLAGGAQGALHGLPQEHRTRPHMNDHATRDGPTRRSVLQGCFSSLGAARMIISIGPANNGAHR